MSFAELMQQEQLFNRCSQEGLIVPIGCGASGNSIVELSIGDATPHYLIGGTTGSGKSNLLHNLIMSACSRYSPDELRVYLLDFKEGVEFSQYANPQTINYQDIRRVSYALTLQCIISKIYRKEIEENGN